MNDSQPPSPAQLIHRVHLPDGFVHVPFELARDTRMSFKARGILIFVLSHSPEFRATKAWVQEHGVEGADAVTSAYKELERFGYVRFEKTRDPLTEQMTGSVWHYYAIPIPEVQRTNVTLWQKEPEPTETPEPGGVESPEVPVVEAARVPEIQVAQNQVAEVRVAAARPAVKDGRSVVPAAVMNPLKDAMKEIFDMDEPTASWWGGVQRAVKEIIAATPGVTPEELKVRARQYRRLHPTWELTPTSLAKYWGGLGGQKPVARAAGGFSSLKDIYS